MRIRLLSLGSTLLFLAVGGVCAILGRASWARDVWMLGVVAMGAPLVFRTLLAIAHGRFATDIVASLSIIGAVALGQPLAGLVIVLMQAGGEALEEYAERRASAAVRALEAPHRAWPVGFAATRSTMCPPPRSGSATSS